MKKSKNNAGFTLVELIVVIAIMAILAGVGTVAYTGYIKSANKGADKQLVGNIVRAVETGHNSYAFPMNEVLQAAANEGIQVPVGFVVVKENGTETIQSASQTTVTDVPCETATITIATSETLYKYKTGLFQIEKEAYVLTGKEVVENVCLTHSKLGREQTKDVGTSNTDKNPTSTKYYIVEDRSTLCTDHTDGEVLDNFETYTSSSATVNADGTLKDSMVATFGDDYATSLKLKYNEWGTSSVSSLFSNGADIWDTFQDKADLATSGIVGLSLKQKYDNSAELVSDYAESITRKYTEEQFVDIWNGILYGNNVDTTIGSAGSEDAFYYAGRSIWNTSLATYVNNHSACKEHVDDIEGYGLNLFVVLPKAVVLDSFDKEIAVNKGKLSPINCPTCQEAAKNYVNSGASTADAKALYQTFKTIKATSTDGIINDNRNQDFFDYYGSYMKEMQTLYQAVNANTDKNRLVISFYYQGGNLTYEVSDKEADPRND